MPVLDYLESLIIHEAVHLFAPSTKNATAKDVVTSKAISTNWFYVSYLNRTMTPQSLIHTVTLLDSYLQELDTSRCYARVKNQASYVVPVGVMRDAVRSCTSRKQTIHAIKKAILIYMWASRFNDVLAIAHKYNSQYSLINRLCTQEYVEDGQLTDDQMNCVLMLSDGKYGKPRSNLSTVTEPLPQADLQPHEYHTIYVGTIRDED